MCSQMEFLVTDPNAQCAGEAINIMALPLRNSHKHSRLCKAKKKAGLVLAALGSDWEKLCKPNICTLNKKLKAIPLMSLIMFAVMTVPVKLCTCHLI